MRILLLLLSTLMPTCAFAADPIADLYFSGSKDPKLNSQETAALALVKQWNADSTKAVKPVTGADGAVQYLFGASQPSIVCAVLQVTDIELEPGEQVNSIHLGDSARWLVEPAVTGYGATEVQHLIIKPKDVGLQTSLMVTTDRRSYHMRLVSTRNDYIPRVSFVYPDVVMAKWDAIKSHREKAVKRETIPATGGYLGDLDFNYEVSGRARWKPLRVYNDGVKTIIEMPQEMRQTEAPTLLVLRSSETVMVNYRVQGDRYIVDTVFDKAILITGVGSQQTKVTITKKSEKKRSDSGYAFRDKSESSVRSR